MRKIHRDLENRLKLLDPNIKVSQRAKHLVVLLPNGRKAFAANTPSDGRSFPNTIAEVKRKLRAS